MPAPAAVERLRSLPTLASLPDDELEWLAAHGEFRRYEAGDIIFSIDNPPTGTYIVLAGRISFRLLRDGIAHIVTVMEPGGISGLLPYSRLTAPSGKAAPGVLAGFSQADEPVEIFLLDGVDGRTMARECHAFTTRCVHEMVDRTRLFKSADLQRERLASLGRLAAGLAHELNNPSSAVARSATALGAGRIDLAEAARALGAARLEAAQEAALATIESAAARPPDDLHSPMARADREEAIEAWLAGRGLDSGLTDRLMGGAVDAQALDVLAQALTPDQMPLALRYLAASVSTARLTSEVEQAASRIHSLVAAVKKHTHMDRAPAREPVHLEEHLADTLTLIGSKARSRSITLELEAEPDLPAITGIAGELNAVWLNLVDNAIDAAPDGGRVTVSAQQSGAEVIVCVIDNGPGIPEADRSRIFEPFFTTKAVGQGTGLGLDVVQNIVKGHGGAIAVASRPGRTEFRVSLPVAVGAA